MKNIKDILTENNGGCINESFDLYREKINKREKQYLKEHSNEFEEIAELSEELRDKIFAFLTKENEKANDGYFVIYKLNNAMNDIAETLYSMEKYIRNH